MVTHAGICGACQKDIIRQDEPQTIKCPTCRTTWSNNYIKSKKKPNRSIAGFPCYACGEGMLIQKYWNQIYCDHCGSIWKSFRNNFYNKRAQFRTELSKIG